MPLLSTLSQQGKIKYFIDKIPKTAHVLEIGSGSGWAGEYMKNNGWQNYLGLDIVPPSDITGDINQWQLLGLKPNSFDYILAFEVIEHVDCIKACFELLKPEGQLFLTSPLPSMDWVCRIFELLGLNQKRTSPHNHLIYFTKIPLFTLTDYKIVGFMAQWGKLKKCKIDDKKAKLQ